MLKFVNGLRVAGVLLVSLLVTAGVAAAATVTVTLDAGTIPAGVVCNQVWQESEVDLSFVNTEVVDCNGGGTCFFGVGGLDPNGVDLFPSRLNADLTNLPGRVLSVEVDVVDFCGQNCTRAFLYQGAPILDTTGNTIVGSQETLVVNSGAGDPDRFAVSSCEGAVLEIRVTYDDLLPTEESTWGEIKALFR